MRRKGQSASNAAAFIAILTVLIILYILFLPPDVRNELLNGDGSGGTGGTGGVGSGGTVLSTVLSETVGKVSYINTNERTIDIPAVRIYSPTSAQILKSASSIFVRSALFDKEKSIYTMDFDVDTTTTKNVMLSFSVRDSRGILTINLNGREVYSGIINTANPAPIRLDSLNSKNTLTFKVSDPGWNFWSTNGYTLENLQIIGDVTDYKNAQGTQLFSLSEGEYANLDKVRIYFYPTCNFKDVGPLEIQLNRRTIFNAIGDCGTKSFAILDKKNLLEGSNELIFSTDKGSYLLDNIYVNVVLTKPEYKTYFFDMKDDYFETKLERATCGTYDGICPAGCSESVDGDCCFKRNGYWCAFPTDRLNDRCVFYVDSADCDVCPTGYYDSAGETHPNCENKCGDNKDDKCASGCQTPNKYYDQDCCYASNKYNFWCAEVPLSGITDKCKASVSYDECNTCPSGYVDKDGSAPDSCSTVDNTDLSDKDFKLLSDYDVKMTVRFVDDTERKKVDININGHRVTIDTQSIEYTRIIDDYVRKGSNSIEIIPREDINIAELKIEVKRIR